MTIEQQNSPNNKILETILRELNPVHDLENINFKRLSVDDNLKEILGTFRHNASAISYGAYIAKPIFRGLIVGSAFGAVLGSVIDYPFIESVKDGAILGTVLDAKQVSYRAAYKYFKKQIFG